jgi:hypothetical protein
MPEAHRLRAVADEADIAIGVGKEQALQARFASTTCSAGPPGRCRCRHQVRAGSVELMGSTATSISRPSNSGLASARRRTRHGDSPETMEEVRREEGDPAITPPGAAAPWSASA